MAEGRPRLVTALATAVKAARESKGWSQRQLAAEMKSSGRRLSSAYVGLIEAGHRIPAEDAVQGLAEVLGHDAGEWVALRSQAASDKRVVDLARHLNPAAFSGVAEALTRMNAILTTPMRDIDQTAVAEGSKRMQEIMARYGQTPMSELTHRAEARDADLASVTRRASVLVAAEGDASWLSQGNGPRRGRRYELATKLFELVVNLDVDELQRVLGYAEALRENRRPPEGDASD